MSNAHKQHILIAPLDWGLGHATRCAVLIDRWLEKGHEVIIASNGRSAAWLKQRFPHLEVLTDIPDYAVTYPRKGNMALHFARHLPRLIEVVRDEHRWLQRVVALRKIDCVYSDNRYGLYHDDVPCVFITHQLYIRVPWWAKAIIYRILNRHLTQFHSIWVPDYAKGNMLSGALSHGGRWDNRVHYIGPLSRLESEHGQREIPERNRREGYEIVAIISGPEPARSAFEQQLRQLLTESGRSALLILGLPDTVCNEIQGNLTVVNHFSDSELAVVLELAKLVICRSGYSTIMDLHALGVRALLVPTPGQTEQEYLAELHAKQGAHDTIHQKRLTTDMLRLHLQRSTP
jgi:UDP:flavonoid glycosyltransferase YjiC (YdhE family)